MWPSVPELTTGPSCNELAGDRKPHVSEKSMRPSMRIRGSVNGPRAEAAMEHVSGRGLTLSRARARSQLDMLLIESSLGGFRCGRDAMGVCVGRGWRSLRWSRAGCPSRPRLLVTSHMFGAGAGG